VRTEPPVSEPSTFRVDSVIEELSRYKSPGIDGMLALLFQRRSETLHSEIQKFVNSVYNKDNFLCSVGVIVPIYNMRDKAAFTNYLEASRCYQLHTNITQHSSVKVNSIKSKGKVIPLQARCGREGGQRYSSTLP